MDKTERGYRVLKSVYWLLLVAVPLLAVVGLVALVVSLDYSLALAAWIVAGGAFYFARRIREYSGVV